MSSRLSFGEIPKKKKTYNELLPEVIACYSNQAERPGNTF